MEFVTEDVNAELSM